MRDDRFGGMPFACVAVTILVMSVVLAGVTAGMEGSADDVEDVSDQMDALGSATEGMRRHVESGMGSLLLAISTSDGLGGLDEREAVFSERLSDWMGFNMPLDDKGVSGDLVSYDISLVTQSLGTGDAEDGCTPAYLKAVGTVVLALDSGHVRDTVELDVESDGTYGLPLAAGRGSLFESMTQGVTLENMVSYQLTALAEFRVINGYGSATDGGETGTSSILTSDDVLLAYSNALDAIGLICFRDDGNPLHADGRTDLADTMLSGTGDVTLDLSAVYAQALYASVDDMALSWFEYLSGDRILGSLGHDTSMTQRLSDMIVSFLMGDSVHGAESYIEEVMEANGYAYEVYSRPGSGSSTMTYGGYTVTIENPTLDLMGQSWIRYFKSDYYGDKDYLMDFIQSVIRSAAGILSHERGLGAITLALDPTDPVSFAESVDAALQEALEHSRKDLLGWFTRALDEVETTDPFYVAIAEAVSEHQEDFVLEDEFTSMMTQALLDASGGTLEEDDVLSSEEMTAALHGYRKAVYDDLALFDALCDVPGGQPGMVKRIASLVLADKLAFLTVLAPVEDDAVSMWCETAKNMDVNPTSGPMELPSEDCFILKDDDVYSYERLHPVVESDPVAPNPLIVREGCVHRVGMDDDTVASYTTVFLVRVYDHLSYSVTGGNPLADALGSASSRVSGSTYLALDIEVPVVSGWALAGVDYGPNTTFVEDLAAPLLDLLEPILDPLRELLGMMQDILSFLMDKVSEAATYVADAVSRIYERMMAPVERLNDWVMGHIEQFITDSALSVLVSVDLGKQFMEFDIYGYTLRISTSALTWVDESKTLFSVDISGPVSGYMVSAGITVKAKGEVARENIVVTGHGGIEGDGWSIKANIDPLMKSSRHLISVDGEYDDTLVSMRIPDLMDYSEMGLAVSEIPGLGDMVSNIPVPGLGVNVGFDAGFSIRLSNPVQDGLIVNEFESNPSGTDRGGERIELMNNSAFSIDLDGYTLSACSDRKNKTMVLSGSISPGEFVVIEPTFLLVNESGKYTKNGEAIVIKDPYGNEVDKTPTMRDVYNDSQTIQRKFDGSTEWVVAPGNLGETNGSGLVDEILTIEDLKDIVWYAVQKGFEDVGSITDIETLTQFIKSMVHNTIDRTIDHITGRIMEMSVYVTVDMSDMTSSASGGIRLAFRTDSELAADVLRLIAGKVEALVLNVSDPYSIDPERIIPEDVDLEVCLGMRVGFPRIISATEELPEVRAEVVFRANIASLARVVGEDMGIPELECGIRFCDVPTEAIPSVMKPNRKMSHDVWLFALNITWA